MKQFLLNNIKTIEKLEKVLKPTLLKLLDEIFSPSFNCWLGDERNKVKLIFLPPWSGRIKPRQLMEFQKVTEESDGPIIYEA